MSYCIKLVLNSRSVREISKSRVHRHAWHSFARENHDARQRVTWLTLSTVTHRFSLSLSETKRGKKGKKGGIKGEKRETKPRASAGWSRDYRCLLTRHLRRYIRSKSVYSKSDSGKRELLLRPRDEKLIFSHEMARSSFPASRCCQLSLSVRLARVRPSRHTNVRSSRRAQTIALSEAYR